MIESGLVAGCGGLRRATIGRPALSRALFIGAFGVLALVTSSAFAQSKPAILGPDERGYLEKVALGAARTALYDHVRGLAIDSSLTVGIWIGREVERDRALRKWVREVPNAGVLRVYSDGTGEADLRFDPTDFAEFLRALARKSSSAADGEDAAKLATAGRDWQPLWLTGSAALSERAGPEKPAGWEDISYEGIQVVRRAARADAVRELLETVGRLKVTNARVLSEFLDADSDIESAVVAGLERDATVNLELGSDQVALATATLPTTVLLRILNRVFQEHGAKSGFSAEDFREMAVITQDQELRAAGMAIAPPKYRLLSTYRLIELDAPTWLDQTLRASGRFEPDDETPLEEKARIGAARVDAIDQLRRQVETLVVLQDVTVEDLLARRPELKDDVIVFLTGARLIGTPERLADSGIAVKVELPLRKLWHILRRGIRTVEVEPSDVASQPASQVALPPRNENTAPRSPVQQADDARPEKKP